MPRSSTDWKAAKACTQEMCQCITADVTPSFQKEEGWRIVPVMPDPIAQAVGGGAEQALFAGLPVNQALNAALGQPVNVVNTTFPARTNLEYLGITGLVDTAASLVSGVMTAVAIPVTVGMTITKISCLVGATAASTPTHQFAALYSGTTVAAPPLIGQSTDGTTTAIAASTRADFTLTTANVVTQAQAPYGYLWAAISTTGTGQPSLVTVDTGAAACQYAWFTNTLGGQTTASFGITSGSAVAGTAPATLIYASQKLVVPVVFLT